MNYYSYKNLKTAYDTNPSQENVNALGEWFQQYGDSYWNGEYYDADNTRIYPIYKEISDDQFDIVGYEAR